MSLIAQLETLLAKCDGGAFATKSLIRGELIMLYVDRAGRITADKLEFNSDAPRLSARPYRVPR